VIVAVKEPVVVSVLPDAGVIFVIVTFPDPAVWLSVTGVPEYIKLPTASFGVTVNVTVELPSSATIVPVDVTETVDPVISMGNTGDTTDPAVPVICAVRLVSFLIVGVSPPREKITVPGVVTVGVLRIPVSVLIVTTTSDSEAFEEFNAVTVIVEVTEPSVFIDVGEATRLIEATVPG